jgi:hypothetical protein
MRLAPRREGSAPPGREMVALADLVEVDERQTVGPVGVVVGHETVSRQSQVLRTRGLELDLGVDAGVLARIEEDQRPPTMGAARPRSAEVSRGVRDCWGAQ